MKRVILAGMLALAVVSMTAAAHAADIARRPAMPTKAPAYEPPFNWSGAYRRHQRRRGFGPFDLGRSRHRLDRIQHQWRRGRRHDRLQLADGRRWCWASRATSIGATSRAARPAPSASAASAKPATTGLATTRGRVGYAFGRMMPYITGGAAFGDVEVLDRARQRNRNSRRLDARRRRRSRHRRPVERQGRVPLCRSRQGELQRGHLRHVDRRRLPQQPRARRHQLPLLIAPPFGALTNGPGAESSGAFHSRHPQSAVPFTTDGFRGVADWPRCPAFAIAPRNRCRCDRVECAYRGTAHLRARPSRIKEVRYEKASARKRGRARARYYDRVGRRHRPASRSV